MASKVIQILINAKDEASAVFGNLKRTVVAVGAAIATYLTVDAFVGVVKGAANFEAAMSKVQAATGATKEEMALLEKAAKDASANSSFTSIETAGALENLAKAGLNAADAIGALPPVMSLAEGGGIDLATSSEKLTKIISGMGDKFSEAGRYADVLALGANATNTSVLGLADALSYAAPIAQSLGLKLEPTVAILGKLADAGIDASRSGTALNGILSQFADPASKFRNELALAGITTNDFEKALHQLADAGPRSEKAILSVGQEAGPALRALLNQGMGALDDLTGRLKNAEGSAAATAATMRDNLNGALGSLATAWQGVKDALGAPVLPVLKQAVEQLTAAFRTAVDDGTVKRFGDAIATAFGQAIKFIRDFLANFNFTDAITRLQQFADETNAKLTLISEYATNTANSVKLAWGVMASGSNTVLAAVYGVGSVFADLGAQIQAGVAKWYELFSKLPFGSISKQWAEIGAEIRLSSEATAASAQAMRDKAKQALLDVAEGAQTARDGFMGMVAPVQSVGTESKTASDAMARMAKELQAGAEAAAKFGAAAQKKANDDDIAKRAAKEHGEAIAKLRAEYADFMAKGDLDGAGRKLQEINKALRETPGAAKEAARAAGDAAKEIAAAFVNLKITSTAELKAQADSYKASYETIKKAGTSTAEDISAAFAAAAEAAIAANKGIAPSWVTAEAAARGYKIVVDEAGKSHLELINKAGPGLDRLAKGWQVSREAVEAHEDAMAKMLMRYTMSANYTERQIKLLEREAAAAEKAAEAYRKKWQMDKEGYSLNTAGERVMAGETEQDVSDDVAQLYGEANRDNEKARRARQIRALARLRSQGNGLVTPTQTMSVEERRELDRLEQELLNTAPAKPEETTSSTASAPTKTSKESKEGATRSGAGLSKGTPVVFNFPAGPISVNLQGPDDVTNMASVVSQLMKAKGTAR